MLWCCCFRYEERKVSRLPRFRKLSQEKKNDKSRDNSRNHQETSAGTLIPLTYSFHLLIPTNLVFLDLVRQSVKSYSFHLLIPTNLVFLDLVRQSVKLYQAHLTCWYIKSTQIGWVTYALGSADCLLLYRWGLTFLGKFAKKAYVNSFISVKDVP